MPDANTPPLQYRRTIDDLPGPRPLPLVGNLLQMDRRRIHRTVERWIRAYGPMLRFKVMDRTIVVVADYQLVAQLMRERPGAFRRNQGGVQIMKELKIAGVFTAEGDDWRRQRKLVMRGLNAEVVRNFYPTLVRMTERLCTRWKAAVRAGRPVDVHRDLKAMSLDVIVAVAMGFDIDALGRDGNGLQRDIDNLFRRLGARMAATFPHWRKFRLAADREADAAAGRIEQAVREFIAQARARLAADPQLRARPANMLEAMIVASEEEGSDFTDQELIGNAITSVVGGEDTTANSIAWMVNHLVQHPDALAGLRAEVDGVLGGEPVARAWESMTRLPYLEAVHNESQRLRSVAPLFGLVSNVDCVLGDTFIPKNTPIFASTVAAGWDAAQFPDPQAFRPERWLFDEKPAESDDPLRKLFPFGGGPRLCPGRFLALTEIKAVVAMLVRNFELEFDPSAPPVDELLNFFMVPSGVPVRLKLRADAAQPAATEAACAV